MSAAEHQEPPALSTRLYFCHDCCYQWMAVASITLRCTRCFKEGFIEEVATDFNQSIRTRKYFCHKCLVRWSQPAKNIVKCPKNDCNNEFIEIVTDDFEMPENATDHSQPVRRSNRNATRKETDADTPSTSGQNTTKKRGRPSTRGKAKTKRTPRKNSRRIIDSTSGDDSDYDNLQQNENEETSESDHAEIKTQTYYCHTCHMKWKKPSNQPIICPRLRCKGKIQLVSPHFILPNKSIFSSDSEDDDDVVFVQKYDNLTQRFSPITIDDEDEEISFNPPSTSTQAVSNENAIETNENCPQTHANPPDVTSQNYSTNLQVPNEAINSNENVSSTINFADLAPAINANGEENIAGPSREKEAVDSGQDDGDRMMTVIPDENISSAISESIDDVPKINENPIQESQNRAIVEPSENIAEENQDIGADEYSSGSSSSSSSSSASSWSHSSSSYTSSSSSNSSISSAEQAQNENASETTSNSSSQEQVNNLRERSSGASNDSENNHDNFNPSLEAKNDVSLDIFDNIWSEVHGDNQNDSQQKDNSDQRSPLNQNEGVSMEENFSFENENTLLNEVLDLSTKASRANQIDKNSLAEDISTQNLVNTDLNDNLVDAQDNPENPQKCVQNDSKIPQQNENDILNEILCNDEREPQTIPRDEDEVQTERITSSHDEETQNAQVENEIHDSNAIEIHNNSVQNGLVNGTEISLKFETIIKDGRRYMLVPIFDNMDTALSSPAFFQQPIVNCQNKSVRVSYIQPQTNFYSPIRKRKRQTQLRPLNGNIIRRKINPGIRSKAAIQIENGSDTISQIIPITPSTSSKTSVADTYESDESI